MTFRKLTALLTILTGMAGWTLIAQAQDRGQQFADVPNNHPFADAIRQVTLNEWMVGYPADGPSQPTFRPNQKITNEQIVSVIDNVIENDYPDGMSRGQLADLIADVPWYPDLNWEIITCEPLPNSAVGSGWCVRVPISSKHNAIRWMVYDRYLNNVDTEPEWKSYNHAPVIPVGKLLSVAEEDNRFQPHITMVVQYWVNDNPIYQHIAFYQVVRQIIVGDCPNSRLCWHPEIRTETIICRPDDDTADRPCPSGF